MNLSGGRQVEQVLRCFSFQGRANRQRYWLTSLALIGLLIVALILAQLLGVIGALLGGVAFVAYLVAVLAVAARRLHDRNRSGWWLLPMYLPILVLSFLEGVASAFQEDAGSVFVLLTLPFTIWVFVELGCLRGTMGPNRFGADPLRPEFQAEVFS